MQQISGCDELRLYSQRRVLACTRRLLTRMNTLPR